MKNRKSFIKIIFLIFTVVTSMASFNSCEKRNTPEQETTIEDEFGNFIKELIVYDSTGDNSAVLKLGSNDMSILDMWTANNFDLITIQNGQTLKDIMNKRYPNDKEYETDIENDENDEDNNITASEVSIMIISKDLKDGVKNIAITTKPPYDEDMRGWSYSTYYSQSISDNTVTVNVYGHNRWHKGYWAASYKKHSSTNGWSTIVGEWSRIRNDEAASRTKTPCYKMKARRKYKKGSVTIEFED